MSAGAQRGLPGDAQSMLARRLGQPAGGADLQFKSEFPPQIEEVRNPAILAEQESMKTLQSRSVHANDALRGYCSKGSVFVHGVNTMNARYGADSKSKRGNPARV